LIKKSESTNLPARAPTPPFPKLQGLDKIDSAHLVVVSRFIIPDGGLLRGCLAIGDADRNGRNQCLRQRSRAAL
jgi:hypothetical protein